MFPRGKRLPRGDFAGALAGKSFSTPHFSAVVPRDGEGYAVVVGKAAAKLSTARHLLKRRTLAALRSLKLPPALVVFPKASATGLSFADIAAELKVLAEKISRVE